MTRKTEEAADHPKQKFLGQRPEADLTSQAWEATSLEDQAEAAGKGGDELTPEQQREDRDHPGRIDKETTAEE